MSAPLDSQSLDPQALDPQDEQALLDRLASLYTEPATIGPLAQARRRTHYGEAIVIRAAPAHAIPTEALVVRGPRTVTLPGWPAGAHCLVGDRLVVAVAATPEARTRYVAWLRALSLPEGCAVAPCSADDAALHRLWCIAATRMCLPTRVRVEARHDLLGIGLTQLALAMGADTVAGPIEASRVLPLAGVPRPNESTRDGLAALVRHAGLNPEFPPAPDDAPRPARASEHHPHPIPELP